MTQHYSDPARESDPHALPDVEAFQARYQYCPDCGSLVISPGCASGACGNPDTGAIVCGRIVRLINLGWFYWFCMPGCLPDSEPFGPFATEEEAIADARSFGE